MKIHAAHPVTVKTIADLDPEEQFDFTKRYSKARTYRATRVFVEWQWQAGKWTPRKAEWSGPMVRKGGGLSDAAGGSESHTFSPFNPDGVSRQVNAAMGAIRATLPTITARPLLEETP